MDKDYKTIPGLDKEKKTTDETDKDGTKMEIQLTEWTGIKRQFTF